MRCIVYFVVCVGRCSGHKSNCSPQTIIAPKLRVTPTDIDVLFARADFLDSRHDGVSWRFPLHWKRKNGKIFNLFAIQINGCINRIAKLRSKVQLSLLFCKHALDSTSVWLLVLIACSWKLHHRLSMIQEMPRNFTYCSSSHWIHSQGNNYIWLDLTRKGVTNAERRQRHPLESTELCKALTASREWLIIHAAIRKKQTRIRFLFAWTRFSKCSRDWAFWKAVFYLKAKLLLLQYVRFRINHVF